MQKTFFYQKNLSYSTLLNAISFFYLREFMTNIMNQYNKFIIYLNNISHLIRYNCRTKNLAYIKLLIRINHL